MLQINLNTVVSSEDPRRAVVQWGIGQRVDGIFNVSVPDKNFADKEVGLAAELMVLRHLIEHHPCANRMSWCNVLITSTFGGMEKLHQGSYEGKNFVDYAWFLRTLLHDAKLQTNQSQAWTKTKSEKATEEAMVVNGPKPFLHTNQLVGQIEISEHALQRAMQRCRDLYSMDIAYRALRKALGTKDITETVPPDSFRDLIMKRYGKASRWLYHRGTGLYLIIVPKANYYRIATVINYDNELEFKSRYRK